MGLGRETAQAARFLQGVVWRSLWASWRHATWTSRGNILLFEANAVLLPTPQANAPRFGRVSAAKMFSAYPRGASHLRRQALGRTPTGRDGEPQHSPAPRMKAL